MKIKKEEINVLVFEHVFGGTLHEKDCDNPSLQLSKDISFGCYSECRSCDKMVFFSDYVGDANHTNRARDKAGEKLNAEWLYCSKRWTLRRYENQFPVVLACCPYEDEGMAICITALTAVMGEEIELED